MKRKSKWGKGFITGKIFTQLRIDPAYRLYTPNTRAKIWRDEEYGAYASYTDAEISRLQRQSLKFTTQLKSLNYSKITVNTLTPKVIDKLDASEYNAKDSAVISEWKASIYNNPAAWETTNIDIVHTPKTNDHAIGANIAGFNGYPDDRRESYLGYPQVNMSFVKLNSNQQTTLSTAQVSNRPVYEEPVVKWNHNLSYSKWLNNYKTPKSSFIKDYDYLSSLTKTDVNNSSIIEGLIALRNELYSNLPTNDLNRYLNAFAKSSNYGADINPQLAALNRLIDGPNVSEGIYNHVLSHIYHPDYYKNWLTDFAAKGMPKKWIPGTYEYKLMVSRHKHTPTDALGNELQFTYKYASEDIKYGTGEYALTPYNNEFTWTRQDKSVGKWSPKQVQDITTGNVSLPIVVVDVEATGTTNSAQLVNIASRTLTWDFSKAQLQQSLVESESTWHRVYLPNFKKGYHPNKNNNWSLNSAEAEAAAQEEYDTGEAAATTKLVTANINKLREGVKYHKYYDKHEALQFIKHVTKNGTVKPIFVGHNINYDRRFFEQAYIEYMGEEPVYLDTMFLEQASPQMQQNIAELQELRNVTRAYLKTLGKDKDIAREQEIDRVLSLESAVNRRIRAMNRVKELHRALPDVDMTAFLLQNQLREIFSGTKGWFTNQLTRVLKGMPNSLTRTNHIIDTIYDNITYEQGPPDATQSSWGYSVKYRRSEGVRQVKKVTWRKAYDDVTKKFIYKRNVAYLPKHTGKRMLIRALVNDDMPKKVKRPGIDDWSAEAEMAEFQYDNSKFEYIGFTNDGKPVLKPGITGYASPTDATVGNVSTISNDEINKILYDTAVLEAKQYEGPYYIDFKIKLEMMQKAAQGDPVAMQAYQEYAYKTRGVGGFLHYMAEGLLDSNLLTEYLGRLSDVSAELKAVQGFNRQQYLASRFASATINSKDSASLKAAKAAMLRGLEELAVEYGWAEKGDNGKVTLGASLQKFIDVRSVENSVALAQKMQDAKNAARESYTARISKALAKGDISQTAFDTLKKMSTEKGEIAFEGFKADASYQHSLEMALANEQISGKQYKKLATITDTAVGEVELAKAKKGFSKYHTAKDEYEKYNQRLKDLYETGALSDEQYQRMSNMTPKQGQKELAYATNRKKLEDDIFNHRIHGRMTEADAARLKQIKSNQELARSIQEVVIKQHNAIQNWHKLSKLYDFNNVYQTGYAQFNSTINAAAGVVPRAILTPIQRAGAAMINGFEIDRAKYNYWMRTANTIKDTIAVGAGIIGTAIPGGGPMLGYAMHAGAQAVGQIGIATWNQHLYGKERTFIERGQNIQNTLNTFGLLKSITGLDFAFGLLAKSAKIAAVGIAGMVVKGLHSMHGLGTPLTGLTNISFKQSQQLKILDNMLGLSPGSTNSSIEDFALQQRQLYTYGKYNTDRMVAASMLGVFNQVYANGGDPQKNYAAMIDTIANRKGGITSDVISWSSMIDKTLPRILQVMKSVGATSFNDMYNKLNVYYRPIDDKERDKMYSTSAAYRMSLAQTNNSMIRLSSAVWDNGLGGLFNRFNKWMDTLVQKAGVWLPMIKSKLEPLAKAIDKFFSVLANDNRGKGELASAFDGMLQEMKNLLAKLTPPLFSVIGKVAEFMASTWGTIINTMGEKAMGFIGYLSTLRFDKDAFMSGDPNFLKFGDKDYRWNVSNSAYMMGGGRAAYEAAIKSGMINGKSIYSDEGKKLMKNLYGATYDSVYRKDLTPFQRAAIKKMHGEDVTAIEESAWQEMTHMLNISTSELINTVQELGKLFGEQTVKILVGDDTDPNSAGEVPAAGGGVYQRQVGSLIFQAQQADKN